MIKDGLVQDDDTSLTVMPQGRLQIRAICQVFDAHRKANTPQRFSRII